METKYDSTWSEFEIALMEVVKQLPRLNPVKEIDFEQPTKYGSVTRPKAYIQLQDKIFYCPRCGMIPIMQQHQETKQYRACCPKCRIYAPDGVHSDKHGAYKKWNDNVKRILRGESI